MVATFSSTVPSDALLDEARRAGIVKPGRFTTQELSRLLDRIWADNAVLSSFQRDLDIISPDVPLGARRIVSHTEVWEALRAIVSH